MFGQSQVHSAAKIEQYILRLVIRFKRKTSLSIILIEIFGLISFFISIFAHYDSQRISDRNT